MMTMVIARPHGEVLTAAEMDDVDDLILGVRDDRMLEFQNADDVRELRHDVSTWH